MFQPYGSYDPNQILPPQHLQALLHGISPIIASLSKDNLRAYPQSFIHAGAILGGYLAGRGYPPERAAAWVEQWLNTPPAIDWPGQPAESSVPTPESYAESGYLVRSAEADDAFRTLLSNSINGEATASIFYANIADALHDAGLEQAAQWVREASRDEKHHLTLLQQRYRTVFGNPYKPLIGNTTVEDLKTALTEAIGDEFSDARKYRNAYLAATDSADQRIFFELATDELRHMAIMNYSIQALP